MNITAQVGRFTADPEIRYGGANNTAIAKFTLAVDRRFKREGQPSADFHTCVAFGKTAELIEKYCKKGMKVAVYGEVQNNNYEDKNGTKHYGYQILVDNIEFCEKKGETAPAAKSDEFMTIPDTDMEELPFV